ncbi:unnamed protein product [Darwinula stevensoni]|uniref:MTOR-associated protein MEAK7 n=1 Tax=Darwinula stevensoni TaxID=69355 RepID=A0A7R8X1G0_9CRUS|nr:unnamed protein product [Darwinula stevensoni]CAG0879947.1 unnamed protein product [Darwinula stevensoni]
MFQSYAKCAADSTELSKWSFQSEEAEAEAECFAEYILQDLVFEKMSLKACFDEEFPLREVTRDKLERWYLESQLFPKLQQTVFSRVFLGKSQPSVVPLPVQADSGFGGRLEYFGLWLDSEFGTGRANASCTTYHSPQLCKSQEFHIDHMEVWGVGEEPEVDETERASVLDVDPEAKALLEMAGRRMASDGIRESDAKDLL